MQVKERFNEILKNIEDGRMGDHREERHPWSVAGDMLADEMNNAIWTTDEVWTFEILTEARLRAREETEEEKKYHDLVRFRTEDAVSEIVWRTVSPLVNERHEAWFNSMCGE
jgi:hypothetical protein